MQTAQEFFKSFLAKRFPLKLVLGQHVHLCPFGCAATICTSWWALAVHIKIAHRQDREVLEDLGITDELIKLMSAMQEHGKVDSLTTGWFLKWKARIFFLQSLLDIIHMGHNNVAIEFCHPEAVRICKVQDNILSSPATEIANVNCLRTGMAPTPQPSKFAISVYGSPHGLFHHLRDV